MKTAIIDEKTARELYPNSPAKLKAILEQEFGKDFFLQNLKDRIKTWEDAAKLIGPSAEDLPYKSPANSDHRACNAFFKLTLIIRLIKEGVRLDYNNPNQSKYYPWFKYITSGFAFAGTYAHYVSTDASVGPRLSSKTDTDARWVAKNFPDLYTDLFDESDIYE